MWLNELPPFVPFFIAALLAMLTRGPVRVAIMLIVPVLGAIQLYLVPETVSLKFTLLDYTLSPYRIDKLSLLFGYLFHLAAFISIIYAIHVRDTTQQVASLVYAGSALGAVFAGDLISLFVFWELLAISSVFLVWARRSERSYASGMRYLIIQVFSGVLLLVGTLFYFEQSGSLEFNQIGLDDFGIAGWLILIAFGIKCAFPFFHNWLTDAYAEATPTGSVFLSAFTTKVAIYALARGYPGTEILVYIGAMMTCFPIFYAVIENDLRRVLAYSMINQIGFMVTGIGIGTALAINGAVSHAFNDVIFKGLLFMSMGAVLKMTGRINGSELGGLYKSMPKTTLLCIIGAASISAFPLFSGFVSKSMVMSAALENNYDIIWLMLLFASAGVFHHAGIKIPFFAFFAHDSGIRTTEPPINMLIAMSISATLCITIGIYPSILYQLLPYNTGYNPYDATHVLAQTQLLFFSALAFVWLNLKGWYPPELRSINIDIEWFYRRIMPYSSQYLISRIETIDQSFRNQFVILLKYINTILYRYNNPTGIFSKLHTTGSMVMWVIVLLFLYLFFSFIQ